MATLEISNVLKAVKRAFKPHAIATKFTYPNPKYQENERLGFSNFGVPHHIHLYKENGKHIFLPRGLLKEVFSIGSGLQITDHTATVPVYFDPSRIDLKDHQILAVTQMLERNQGLLVAPPGSGKTITAIEVIVRRNQRSLVLVHTKDLLEQWIERFHDFTDIAPGVIQEGRFEVRDVTIGMVQSLNRQLESGFYLQFGLVLLDEAHHCPAFTFQKLVNQFPARYRYGLTATPERKDGLSFVLTAVMGNVIHEIGRNDLFQIGEIIMPAVKAIHTNFFMANIKSYGTMITAICEDEERNELILKLVAEEAVAGHYCLVLSERIDHVHTLLEEFCCHHRGISSAGITSRSSRKIRTVVLNDMRKGRIRVLFSTKLADEGLDIPRLDRLFLTCPIRSTNKVNQQVGRILRSFPGKKDTIVYDFRDSLVSLTESQYHTRLKEVYHEFDVLEVPYVKQAAD